MTLCITESTATCCTKWVSCPHVHMADSLYRQHTRCHSMWDAIAHTSLYWQCVYLQSVIAQLGDQNELKKARLRFGLEYQNRSRRSLSSKLPDLRLVGDIALKPSFRKSKNEQSQHCLQYRIDSTCTFFLPMYTLIILTMRLSAECNVWPKTN